MKAVVFTLGCKVNEVESASIMASLENMGFETSDKLGLADIYVLNTCAVTKEAEKKSRQLIARAKKFNPDAKIFVCGCASEKDRQTFVQKGAAFVCGAGDKNKIVSAVASLINGKDCGLRFPKQTKTRAFIKIQDGCNNFCSYCIIPYLRGREKSRYIDDIMGEIAQTDCPEIVINGINISSYGYGEVNLCDLIAALKPVQKRIRLGSLECGIINEELLTELKNLCDFAPQFHLSLQSGSSSVLKSMNRHYTREQYAEKCQLIYKFFPQAAITTDISAGFPTETEEDFLQSLSLIGEIGFARIHAFAFSPREGTVAYKLQDLSYEVKNERLHRLLKAGQDAAEKYIKKFLNTTVSFLAEEYEDGFTTGYTPNYIKVYIPARLAAGKIYNIKLKELFKDGANAEII